MFRPPASVTVCIVIGDSEVRPWGSWVVLDEGDGYKVKRINVNPHSRLSYQTHDHRSEWWSVISGTASSVIDGNVVHTGPGQSVEVAVGVPHRIVNEQDDELVIIEIQRGDYCGEDDIVRLEDDFGRVPAARTHSH
ncbi:hypothetical protein Back2_13540 [Nocardioides baekrokdamisoli]|uniref:Mannose-6-phosphate isomerase type II C-terminal domain-containing protein n=1 Tax=Nocardioides baekrokdamisoli TaxID=1804624 RepID=A0A3G9IDN5_9ACTN|nr:hypothetical protein Back2_13540 [Nocardioides baekrokdamisoli]